MSIDQIVRSNNKYVRSAIEDVFKDKDLQKYMTDPTVVSKVEEIVNTHYGKYKDVFSGYAPKAATVGRWAGTAGSIGSDILYVASGGLGSLLKLYSTAGRAALEAPTMLKIASKEGLYHGSLSMLKWFGRKVASFLLPFGGVLDLKDVKSYATDAIKRESLSEVRGYLKMPVAQRQPITEHPAILKGKAAIRNVRGRVKDYVREAYAAMGPKQTYQLV